MRLVDVHDLDILGYLEEFPECESDKAWNAAVREICAYVNLAPEVDAMPVVRCKDCERWDDDPDTYGADNGPKGKCMKSFETMCADDFCSYGERKDEANES